MLVEYDERHYNLTAPDVDDLLFYFCDEYKKPCGATPELGAAMEPIFDLLTLLEPKQGNNETKTLWLRIPRGTIEDYESFENMKEYGEVTTYEEYLDRWHEDYPEEYVWYQLVVVESFNRDDTLRFRAIALNNKTIINVFMDGSREPERDHTEKAAVKLCELILPAIRESMDQLKAGSYNDLVSSSLPYKYRTGIIRRSVLWEYDPAEKKTALDGLSEDAVRKLRTLIESGVNAVNRIGRIQNFTANDYFRACRIGYESIGMDCEGYSPSELYMHYADGRDEGLTGKGFGLNAGPGIDFDAPGAWDEWYYHRENRYAGHPWEVVPGGNSTHVELYVQNDKQELDWDLQAGEISEEEYTKRIQKAGYYFAVVGLHRQYEAVNFYLALSDAGLPVILGGADKLLARLKGSDYIGIVPHHLFTQYCEDLFPEEYGEIVDFIHVYDDEMSLYGDKIIWLPVEEAKLQQE